MSASEPTSAAQIAKVLDDEGRPVGAGVLVAADLVLTCAHVLGQEQPVEAVTAEFPFLDTGPVRAQVHFWSAPGEPLGKGDLAVLRLDGAVLPPDIQPLGFASDAPVGLQVITYGFPRGYDDGRWTSMRTVGGLPNGLMQLEGSGLDAGYSGGPVFDTESGTLLGIVVAADRERSLGFMRPLASLMETWPHLGTVVIREPMTPPQNTRGGAGARERTQWVSDAPTDDDMLKRAALAKVLATHLRQARADTPDSSFLVHVDGSWGTGKSTLLKLLARELWDDSLVVFFDTWRHVRIEPPWWALLTAVRKAVIAGRPRWRRPWFRVRELFARIHRDGAAQVLSGLLLVGAAVLAGVLFSSGTVTTHGLEPTLKTITAVVGAVGGLWTAGVVVSRYVMWGSARRARSFEESHTDPMNEVAEHIAWLVRHADRPIVVLVEDLDRCNAGYVVNFLDSVQTLLRDVPERWRRPVHCAPSFVVAMDGVWLRCAYEDAYETFKSAVAEPGRPLGYLFLDKLFQLSVPIPRLGTASRDLYFGRLLGTSVAPPSAATAQQVRAELARSSDETEVLETLARADPEVRQAVASQAIERILDADVQDISHHALAKFSRLLHSNPRAMKRFVNTYTVSRAVRVLEGSVVPTDSLALWTLLRIRWPELADHLESRPETIDQIKEGVEARDLPDTLRELAASAELHGVLRAVPGTQLTPEMIRACSGASDDMTPR
ncbi:P-loop NTPase fold protein [Nonomuraea sp. NPDC049152]|uniref:P-loop NTPase fold protein n=1 Tax=Nonomuraea sp. NPDC049152 TaxID=3154350 RepID=UPI0033D3E6C2